MFIDFSVMLLQTSIIKIYFIDWIDKFIEEAPKRLYKGKLLSPKTIQQYTVTLKKLQAYEKANEKLRFENIDLKFHRNFIHFCRSVENLGDNSISGHIKNIKMWCKNIELEGLPMSPQYKHSEFSGIQTETKDIYLTETEINKIFNHDFKNDIRLSNTRDLFIIGLRTGLRVSDFLRLEKNNLDKKNITIVTTKTKQKVIIPIHKQVSQILESRNGEFPHTISEQKFNKNVKDVCKEAGLVEVVDGAKMNSKTNRKEKGSFAKWELVSSHTCRRSFATNLYGHLPNKTIMAVTGHATETQFLQYIKITNDEFAEILGTHWNKEASNESAKSNLKVI